MLRLAGFSHITTTTKGCMWKQHFSRICFLLSQLKPNASNTMEYRVAQSSDTAESIKSMKLQSRGYDFGSQRWWSYSLVRAVNKPLNPLCQGVFGSPWYK